MYLLYVDESGDVGLNNSPSPYFILSGLIIHELRWHTILDTLIKFRKDLRQRYGLKLREEIHATAFLHKPGEISRIHKSLRLRLLRDVLDFEASLPDINIINIVIDKANKPANYDVFDNVWMILLQRFHNTISYRNFPGPQNPQDNGIVITDNTNEQKLRLLSRRLRRYNPVPNKISPGYRPIPLLTMIEDPVHRDSLHSFLIQLSDVNAYFLYQKLQPCSYIKKKGGRNYFDRLDPVLCKVASKSDPQGIVHI